jgi:protein-tyrosine phosphatase
VIDLREQAELVERPNVFATSLHLRYQSVPFWDSPITERGLSATAQGYRRELDLRGERIVHIYRKLLAEDGLPALIHCAAGKDRTGLIIALLLSVADVPPDAIIADYALSAACLGPEFLEEGREWVTARGWLWEQYAHVWDSPPDRMSLTLQYLQDRWAGANAYLQQHGLSPSELAELRKRLVH